MNKIFIVILLIFFIGCTHQNQRYLLPESPQDSEHYMLPVNHLEAYPVSDTNEILNQVHRNQLGCMLIMANKQSYAIANQTYFIKANSPVMQLFFTNFSKHNNLRWEGKHHSSGGVISLASIEGFLNGQVTCKDT